MIEEARLGACFSALLTQARRDAQRAAFAYITRIRKALFPEKSPQHTSLSRALSNRRMHRIVRDMLAQGGDLMVRGKLRCKARSKFAFFLDFPPDSMDCRCCPD